LKAYYGTVENGNGPGVGGTPFPIADPTATTVQIPTGLPGSTVYVVLTATSAGGESSQGNELGTVIAS
jgi:hypothetical protein